MDHKLKLIVHGDARLACTYTKMITSPISPGATPPDFEKQNVFDLISNTCEFHAVSHSINYILAYIVVVM